MRLHVESEEEEDDKDVGMVCVCVCTSNSFTALQASLETLIEPWDSSGPLQASTPEEGGRGRKREREGGREGEREGGKEYKTAITITHSPLPVYLCS